MFTKILLISGCLGLSSSQNALFRNDALVSRTEVNTPLLGRGSISHHSKTVSDATSTVHRHQTHTTNPGVRVVSSAAPSLVSSPPAVLRSASAPVLLQHNDGRFFALNANLQPGQFFQTADGRIFTLASGDSNSAVVEARDQTDDSNQNNDAVIARDASTTAENTQTSRNAATSLLLSSQNGVSPLALRLLSANANNLNLNGLRSVTPVATQVSPVASAAAASPIFRVNAAPAVTHVATAPVSRITTAPVATVAAAPIARLTPASLTQLAAAPVARITAAPVAHVAAAAPVAHVAAAAPAGRGHLLADSSTSVFTGFYSFPNAGIDFNFR